MKLFFLMMAFVISRGTFAVREENENENEIRTIDQTVWFSMSRMKNVKSK